MRLRNSQASPATENNINAIYPLTAELVLVVSVADLIINKNQYQHIYKNSRVAGRDEKEDEMTYTTMAANNPFESVQNNNTLVLNDE